MRTAQALNELVRWRWTPFAALVGASTIYVAIVALAVPDRIDFARTPRARSTIGQPAAGTTEMPTNESSPSPGMPEHLSPSSPQMQMAPAQNFGPRGFSPVERPDLPPEGQPPPPPPSPPPEVINTAPPPIPPSQPDEQPAPPPAPTAPMDGAQGAIPPRGPMRMFGRQVQQIAAAVGHGGAGGGGAPPSPPNP
jgi:hypothetical protein